MPLSGHSTIARNRMALVLTSSPVTEPVTLAEAKAHLRVDGSDEDALISSLILTSRLHIEAGLGLALIRQDWKLVLDRWPKGDVVELPVRPLLGVSEVRVLDSEGVGSAVDAGAYIVDAASVSPRLVPRNAASWPIPGRRAGGIEIEFTAGYGDTAAAVPAPIRQALLLLVAHWYEHRHPIEIGSPETAIPRAVSDLLVPYRVARL